MQPRVREVLEYYDKGGLLSVELYLNLPGMETDPSTWCGHIKKSLAENRQMSVSEELNTLKQKFNNYKYVSKEKRDSTGANSIDV